MSSSSGSLRDLTSKHQRLTSEWKKRDFVACQATLDQMRLLLTEVTFLPTANDGGDLKDRQKVGDVPNRCL